MSVQVKGLSQICSWTIGVRHVKSDVPDFPDLGRPAILNLKSRFERWTGLTLPSFLRYESLFRGKTQFSALNSSRTVV
jgi:hypothetical protein